MKPSQSLGSLLLLLAALFPSSESACRSGCALALGSYRVTPFDHAICITSRFGLSDYSSLGPYNPDVPNLNCILIGSRLHVPFSCDCINGEFLGHNFSYRVPSGYTYIRIASEVYSNLTTVAALTHFNSFSENNVPTGANLSVIVNCSCGNGAVSRGYGLFETYPIQPGEDLSSVAAAYNFTSQESLLQSYNHGSNFTSGTVFIPTKDPSGNYHPLSSAGISAVAISGIIVAVTVALLLGICLYICFQRRKNSKVALFPSPAEAEVSIYSKGVASRVVSSPFTGITIDISVKFSYEELASATDDFGMTNKIGEGGFGQVYYAELRGEKAAIKKMDMQATNEFLAELKVLTNVHHLNLVRLIGYCTEVSLFLVYEFIENGNLSEHLRGSEKEPLPWLTRIQIALHSAKGLEYIHEYTNPVYIHRDIKSSNILIDKNFRAKVADFGLARLTRAGAALQSKLVGTFGYMPPEYARGEISLKVDVYAFGVVLYELISAKDAVVKANGSATEPMGLAALFEEVLGKPDRNEELKKLVDPRLNQDYPLDSVLAMALLAKCCTQVNPHQRPSMRQIVVSLTTLSLVTENWNKGSANSSEGSSSPSTLFSHRLYLPSINCSKRIDAQDDESVC